MCRILPRTLRAGTFRHADHRFEWTRAEFQAWAERVTTVYGYQVAVSPVRPTDPDVGAPSQLAMFRLDSPVLDAGQAVRTL